MSKLKDFWKNKKTLAISLLLVASIMGITGTYAVVSAVTGTVINTFALGEVNTHIEEEFEGDIKANSTVTKTPRVVNDGPSEAFIRARVTVTPADSAIDLVIDSTEQVLGTKAGVLYNEGADPGTSTEGCGWYYNETDGFYYYNAVVEVGASTRTLFDTVAIGDVTTDFDVTIYQEAVFADGRAAGTIVDVDTIAGTFEAVNKTE